MDYKEFVQNPDLSSLEKVAKWVDTAATAITDLLSRAEAAEARCAALDEARENANEAYRMALERAEKVEKERDAAVEQLRGNCSACQNYSPYHRKGKCKDCYWDSANPACLREYQEDNWEWRGIKEA